MKRLRVCDIVADELGLHEARFKVERPVRDQDDKIAAMKTLLGAFETAAP